MAEVKILPQMTCKVLVVVFNRLTEVVEPYPFKRILLKGSLVHFSFNLNSIKYTIIKIKT